MPISGHRRSDRCGRRVFCRAPVVVRPERAKGPARVGGLRRREFAHRLVETHADDLNEEVDGVAALIAVRPAPIRVLHDEAGEHRHQNVAAAGFDELVPAFFEERNERREPRGADLFAGPRPRFSKLRGVGHSLSSSGVG